MAIRWGIIGTGNIANRFAEGLQVVDDAELVAVGSRSQEKADAFGQKYNAPNRHGSYEALASDPDVDVVYISTPHVYHKRDAILCLENNKAVLCEKPFTINRQEAEEVVALARQKNLFLMEAMWTRYFPSMYRLRELLAEGAIGEVLNIQAAFCFRTNYNPEGRLFAPELGGGALLDVGIYPIALTTMILGLPDSVVSQAQMVGTGVDGQAGLIFKYDSGALAALTCGIVIDAPIQAIINGTEGRVTIHPPFFQPTSFTLEKGGESETFDFPLEGNGYNYEAAEVGRLMQAGETESDLMPLDESLALMGLMDSIRAEWGLKYPSET